jgi:hypothetical protein
MSLNRGEVNPLSVLGMRKLNFIPEHFARITVNNSVDSKLLDHWINYNLNSRYSIKNTLYIGPDNKMVDGVEIGIEDPKELTMLTIGCPHLHTN